MNKFLTVVSSMCLMGFLFLGVTWGEGLLAREVGGGGTVGEWVSRFDYLIVFFSGVGASMCFWFVVEPPKEQ